MLTESNNQPKSKLKSNVKINGLDILSIFQLQESLIQASITLEKISSLLDVNLERMKEVEKLLDNREGVWQLDQAKEFLDIVIANAALGNPQTLTSNGWLVKVSLPETLIEEKNPQD